ncbi:MAG: M3 family oligoendopeptidase [Tissierellia bacterium]|nr:M3 family oligoendopeptidase [Tissierellia bacterium]
MNTINDKIFHDPKLKFSEFKYVRPDFQEIETVIKEQTKDLKEALTTDEALHAYRRVSSINQEAESMMTLANIRHTIDTTDEFYDKEVEYHNENAPRIQESDVEFQRAFLNSRHRKELEKLLGKYLFQKYEMSLEVFSPEIVEDLIEEGRLSMEYQKLLASCAKEYKGETMNLTQLGKYVQDEDRTVRKEASALVAEFFEENTEKLDEIYDKLVKVRHTIAKKLGYENFIDLGYKRMGRLDYNAKDVANYRKQIVEVVVPLAEKLRERQAKRIGISPMKYYDESLQFTTGNAAPHGDRDWMLERASLMYADLSKDTDTFFKFMTERELFDLDSKPGKAGGGYCTYMSKWRSPFIFANFNGTAHDMTVLTHEAGHAFQVFNSRDYDVPEYLWPGMESAEIHSMSMEFFTWPWMKLFFEDEVEKFKFQHLQGAILFLPYGALIDEFQHFVYEHPEVTPAERRAKYRELEKKYLPSRDYDGQTILEEGGFWFRQGHVFQMPFYYIDYTLAQVLALQFWTKDRKDHETAWKDYLNLCKAGGSKPFLELVELANLKNPFIDGTIAETIQPVVEYLDAVDDSAF